MQSRIAAELKLTTHPVAILFTNDKPKDAFQFEPGKWACVIGALTAAATEGRTHVFDRNTTGCTGAITGLCFGSAYDRIPGGFEYFLSTGRGEGYPEGEGYKKTPELVRSLVDHLQTQNIPFTYVVFKPLRDVDPDAETPQLVCFYANPDQLSGLVVLANYGRQGYDNVVVPFGSGCSTICLHPYNESLRERPRAVVGLTDVSARPYVPPNTLTFTVPYAMFREMEENIPGSFLEKHAWRKVAARIG